MFRGVRVERNRGRVVRGRLILALLAATLLPNPASAQPPSGEAPARFEAASLRPAFVSGQLLIKFRPSSSREQMERAAREMGGAFVDLVTPDGLAKVRFDPSANIV